jgi:hypothetical protein
MRRRNAQFDSYGQKTSDFIDAIEGNEEKEKAQP